MALNVLNLIPDQASYAVTDGEEVISVSLDGGSSRFRRDILRSPFLVNVKWTLSQDEYNYIRAFYKTGVESGSSPFLIQLLIDSGELEEYEAHFVPNSFKLSSVKATSYTVTSQLEVIQKNRNEQDDWAKIMEYEFNYHYGEDSEVFLVLLDELVNVHLPEGLEQQ